MEQIDFLTHSAELSRTRRDLGIERAQRRAERLLGHDWTERAAALLAEFARNIAAGQAFTIEEARDWIGLRIEQPANLRAWGAAVRAAARDGLIEKTGGVKPSRCSNQSPALLWRAAS